MHSLPKYPASPFFWTLHTTFFTVLISLSVLIFAGCSPDDIIAINVLLAPEAEIQTKSIELNKKIVENNPANFTLNDKQIPHITLLQAYVHERALPVIQNELKELVDTAGDLLLEVDALAYSEDTARSFSMINIKRDTALQQLHEEIIHRLQPFILTNGGPEAFALQPDHAEIDAFTLEYVPVFVRNHSFDNFNPHISLGTADTTLLKALTAEVDAIRPFRVSYLGIYQLGREGVARQLLWRQE